jgi:hypothetical protein
MHEDVCVSGLMREWLNKYCQEREKRIDPNLNNQSKNQTK